MQQVQEQPELDQAGRARNLFAARSGKQVSGPATAQSNLAERAAAADTQAQLGQVQQQAGLGVAQLQQAGQQQTQQFQNTMQNLGLQQQGQQQAGQIQRSGILQQSAEGRAELSQARRQSQLEQQAWKLAQQDKQYLDTLRREGDMRRLNSEIRFKEDLQREIIGLNAGLLKQDIANRNILDMDDRQFKRQTQAMSIQDILAGLRQEARDARNLGAINAIGGVAATGIGAAVYADEKGLFDE